MEKSLVKYLFVLLSVFVAGHLQATPSSSLSELAQQQGSVRVIIQLNEAVEPDGILDRAQSLSQQQRVLSAQQQVLQRLSNAGLPTEQMLRRQFRRIPALVMEVDGAALASLEQDPMVLRVVEDTLSRPMLDVSIPLIRADALWPEVGAGGSWAVAVLDTGVDKGHAFFQDRVIAEACYSSNYAPHVASSLCPGGVETSTAAGSAADCTGATGCGHGTHVAGIAAGYWNDDLAGVAKGANIIAIQVFSKFDSDSCGSLPRPCVLSYISDQAAALEHVADLHTADNGIQIAAVNMSLGGGSYAAACDDWPQKPAIDELLSLGIATIIASGNNSHTGAISAPACISSAIAVGASDDSDTLAGFSNHSELVDLLAPGVDIESAAAYGSTVNMSGTSMATPHVAGAFTALRSLNTGKTVAELLTALSDTGVSIATRAPTRPRIDLAAAHYRLQGEEPISLEVILEPEEARGAGAQWRIDGGDWRDSGYEETGLDYATEYTVEFSALDANLWRNPSSPITVNSGFSEVSSTVTYVPIGSLRVDISPAEAVDAGAMWRRVGESAWRASGDTETDLPAGSYQVEYRSVSGWNRPSSENTLVEQGLESGITANYSEVSSTSGGGGGGGGATGWLMLLLLLGVWAAPRSGRYFSSTHTPKP